MDGPWASLDLPFFAFLHTHTQRCWCWQEGIKQTWQLGCFQLVASQLLWCRFPGRAWLALQSGISAVTTN